MARIYFVFFCLLISCKQKTEIIENNNVSKENILPTANANNDNLVAEKDKDSVLIYPSIIIPIDESYQSDTLYKTIQRLKNIISERDTAELFKLMDSNIVSSHGGAIIGYNGVKEVWKNSNIWNKLDQIIALGGVFEKNHSIFRLPYCQADKFYRGWGLDWYTAGVVTTSPTLLYESPDLDSRVIDTLKYSIVETVDFHGFKPENGMIKVKPVDSGVSGYIRYKNFYSTSDYMLIFEMNDNDNWIITSFAPYD